MSPKSILWIGALAFGFFSFAADVKAQSASSAPTASQGVYMAFLDTDVIYSQSKAMKNMHEQLAKFQEEIKTSLDQEKLALQKEEDELQRKRTLLAPEVFAEERKKFQTRLVALQRKFQESSLKLNQVRAEATNKVSQVFTAAVTEIAKKNGITIVFQKSQIVIASAQLDITKIVLEELDKRLPSVQVTNPLK